MISSLSFVFPIRRSVQVNISSPAGSYASSSPPFFHYVVRLNEADITLLPDEEEALAMLGAIPHAYCDDSFCEGPGWRVLPACFCEDWPVLETEPQRLRKALEVARSVMWRHAATVGITAREILTVDEEIDKVLQVVEQAESAGFNINMTYVS